MYALSPCGIVHTMYRRRRNHKQYLAQVKKPGGCQFCDPAEIDYRLKEQTKHLNVIPHHIPYDVWEHHKVLECLMVIPKRHVAHLNELKESEMLDLMKLIGRYESDGYNVYARAPSSPRRSQGHQHTHLIKIDKKEPRFTALLLKPYWLIRF